MTRVYRIELMVLDSDDLGPDAVRSEIEAVSYPNDCIAPLVARIEERAVEWTDDHPLNRPGWQRAFAEMFRDKG